VIRKRTVNTNVLCFKWMKIDGIQWNSMELFDCI
jgi:hypothetical protein